jgi:hypothetical protein
MLVFDEDCELLVVDIDVFESDVLLLELDSEVFELLLLLEFEVLTESILLSESDL